MYKFTKKIWCEDPDVCSENIMNNLQTKFGFKIHGPTPEGHISINHHNDQDHILWIFLYNSNGMHESENSLTKQIMQVKSDKVKKFNGTYPSQKEIESNV
tara:strand:+ start:27 stop:326 length:300 start_codon:yes stop_codon:yes gene_type:complete